MSSRSNRRQGAVLVLVVICLASMIAIVALAVDGGLLMDQRRRAQAAADAGALAGAVVLLNNTIYGTSQNPTTAAQNVAALNMPGSQTAVVYIPPQQSLYGYNGKSGYVEVIVTYIYNQRSGFSQIFGSGNITITGHAIAAGLLQPLNSGMIVLGQGPGAPMKLVTQPLI